MGTKKALLLSSLILLLAACTTSRYQQTHDSIPTKIPNQAQLNDAIPRAEAHSRGGNKNYQVRGINYQVMANAQSFEQTGIASWYGKKFHGHLTSNGEIYDMYAMSAAHKNLPLPTYVKVTNLSNNKTVVVRVNDRGPFHQSRVIDLSYSAAYKLGMLNTGTAQVKITAITDFIDFPAKLSQATSPVTSGNSIDSSSVDNNTNTAVIANTQDKKVGNKFIQLFATSNIELAKKTVAKLSKQYLQAVKYQAVNGLYRIQIGPVINEIQQVKLLEQVKQNGYPQAYLRTL